MSRSFYPSDHENKESHDDDLIPTVIRTSTVIVTDTLPTGNQITQSLPLTDKFHRWRNTFINQVDLIRAEWETQKSAARNETASAEDYLMHNVFNNMHENKELLVPSAILSVGAFFCGRVLSNKANWGNSNTLLMHRPSILGKICTSLPSRIFLPLVLAGTVFSQLTPHTFANTIKTIERDALPDRFVNEYHRIWREVYIDGVVKREQQLCDNVNNGLQKSLRSFRKIIEENLNN